MRRTAFVIGEKNRVITASPENPATDVTATVSARDKKLRLRRKIVRPLSLA